MTRAYGSGSGGGGRGQVLPLAPGLAPVSLNPPLDISGLRGRTGGGWGSGLPGA